MCGGWIFFSKSISVTPRLLEMRVLWKMVLWGATFNAVVVVGMVSLLLFRLSMAILCLVEIGFTNLGVGANAPLPRGSYGPFTKHSVQSLAKIGSEC